jgi:hypothetical protein
MTSTQEKQEIINANIDYIMKGKDKCEVINYILEKEGNYQAVKYLTHWDESVKTYLIQEQEAMTLSEIKNMEKILIKYYKQGKTLNSIIDKFDHKNNPSDWVARQNTIYVWHKIASSEKDKEAEFQQKIASLPPPPAEWLEPKTKVVIKKHKHRFPKGTDLTGFTNEKADEWEQMGYDAAIEQEEEDIEFACIDEALCNVNFTYEWEEICFTRGYELAC